MTQFFANSIRTIPESMVGMVEKYHPIVVRFDFAAGFPCKTAAVAVWLGSSFVLPLSLLKSLMTGLAARSRMRHVLFGGAYRMRAVGAPVIRTETRNTNFFAAHCSGSMV